MENAHTRERQFQSIGGDLRQRRLQPLPQDRGSHIGGHIAVIGILSGTTATLPLHTVLTRQLRLKGLVVGHRRCQMDMIRAIDAIGLRPVIDRHFSLEQIVEAFRYQESRHHFGKICLDI